MCECKHCCRPIESTRKEEIEKSIAAFNEKLMKLSLDFQDETGIKIQDIIIKFADKK